MDQPVRRSPKTARVGFFKDGPHEHEGREKKTRPPRSSAAPEKSLGFNHMKASEPLPRMRAAAPSSPNGA